MKVLKISIKLLILISFTGVNLFSLSSYGFGEELMNQAKGTTSTDKTQVQAPDARNSAANGADQQKGGAGSNSAMSSALNAGGAALIAGGIPMMSSYMCSMCGTGAAMIAGGVVLMGLGMLAGKQAGEDNKAAGLSTDAMNGYNAASGFNNKGANAAAANDPNASEQFKANQAKLAKLGFKVNPKTATITTPDGKVINAKDLTTQAGAMAATGISAEGYKDIMGKANDIMAKALADLKNGKGGDMYGDGSGGGSGSRTVIVDEDPNANGGAAGAGGGADGKNKVTRGLADVSGLTKNFNGQLIGVAADSIFAMMTRRYVLKDKQNFFLSSEDSGKPAGH